VLVHPRRPGVPPVARLDRPEPFVLQQLRDRLARQRDVIDDENGRHAGAPPCVTARDVVTVARGEGGRGQCAPRPRRRQAAATRIWKWSRDGAQRRATAPAGGTCSTVAGEPTASSSAASRSS